MINSFNIIVRLNKINLEMFIVFVSSNLSVIIIRCFLKKW